MMKKDNLSSLNFVFPLIFVLMLFLQFDLVHAAEYNPTDEIKKEVGISPEDLPKSVDEIKDKYLTQQWEELINNNKYLGPVHRFLKNFFLIKILFGEQYSLSLTFILIVALWLFIGIRSGALLAASEIIKGWTAAVIGFLLATILAQTGILKTISVFAVSVVLKSENWWIRLILFLVLILLFVTLFYLSAMIERSIKQSKLSSREASITQSKKELKALTDEMKR